MAKKTLLDIVQDILSDMNSDEVNSISDTTEATQVAAIVRSSYEALMAEDSWPHKNNTFQLEGLGDVNKPTHMRLPEDVIDLDIIKYNKATDTDTNKKYEDVGYLLPSSFIDLVMGRNSDNSNVTVVSDVVDLLIITDSAPTYYTSFDDEYLVFDAHDSDVDTTLQSSKTLCYGEKRLPWTHSDAFVPDISEKLYPLLINKAKSICFTRIKQAADPSSEADYRRARTRLAQNKFRVNGGIIYPDYGRN